MNRIEVAFELAERHLERAREATNELCRFANDADNTVDCEPEDMEHIADLADQVALSYRTASMLKGLLPALSECPNCGANLRSWAKQAVNAGYPTKKARGRVDINA